MSGKICAFTGHRQLPAGKREELSLLLDGYLLEFYRAGFRIFRNGGAIGFDLLAAERVLALR